MFRSILVLFSCAPLFLSCQEQKTAVVKMEETSVQIDLKDGQRIGSFYLSGQMDKDGYGLVDLQSHYFCFQKKLDGVWDSMPVPKNHDPNFYNVIHSPNGNYYFLDPTLGFFLLTKEEPVLLDRISSNPELSSNGLMISNVLNCFEFASFKDEDHLIIPVSWNYLNPQGMYKKFNRPVPRYCEYNIKTKEMRLLHCMTPKESFKEDYANRERSYFGTVNGDTLIMSMPHKSEVILYSISQDREIGRVECKSTFHTDPIKQFGLTGKKRGQLKLDRYEIETPFYGTMFYNKERKEYYRIFYHKLHEKNEKGEFTIYSDKESSIMVFDKNLNLKKEILFEKNAFILFGITSTKKGFIVNTYGQMINEKFTNFEIIL